MNVTISSQTFDDVFGGVMIDTDPVDVAAKGHRMTNRISKSSKLNHNVATLSGDMSLTAGVTLPLLTKLSHLGYERVRCFTFWRKEALVAMDVPFKSDHTFSVIAWFCDTVSSRKICVTTAATVVETLLCRIVFDNCSNSSNDASWELDRIETESRWWVTSSFFSSVCLFA